MQHVSVYDKNPFFVIGGYMGCLLLHLEFDGGSPLTSAINKIVAAIPRIDSTKKRHIVPMENQDDDLLKSKRVYSVDLGAGWRTSRLSAAKVFITLLKHIPWKGGGSYNFHS